MAVLIADDTIDNRAFAENVLKNAGHSDIITASSARDALSALGIPANGHSPRKIDLILMGGAMPDMDGIQACRIIKSDKRYRDTPLMILTAKPEGEDLPIAFAAGATDYIRKPIDTVVLRARVSAALQLKHEMDSRKAREKELLETKRLLELANENLHRLASVDSLTGIANRRRFDECLTTEWRRGVRHKSVLSLVFVDIDAFKKFNDTHGHRAGDACLIAVAQTLSECVGRATDMIARYGGEELAAVLPETSLSGAVVVAERMRKKIEKLRIGHGETVGVTISLGIGSTIPSNGIDMDLLLSAADRALYKAKQAGKNCVRTAEL